MKIIKQCLRTPYIGAYGSQLFDDPSLTYHLLIACRESFFGLF